MATEGDTMSAKDDLKTAGWVLAHLEKWLDSATPVTIFREGDSVVFKIHAGSDAANRAVGLLEDEQE